MMMNRVEDVKAMPGHKKLLSEPTSWDARDSEQMYADL